MNGDSVPRSCERTVRDLCVFCNKTAKVETPQVMGQNGPVNTILFIEDDDQIRLALRLVLEDEGFSVTEAPDGRSGLAARRNQSRIDSIILGSRNTRLFYCS